MAGSYTQYGSPTYWTSGNVKILMDVSGICGFLKTHNLSAYSWPSLRQTSVSKLTICPWELFGLVALEETLLSFSWRKSHWQNGLLSRILHLLKTFFLGLLAGYPCLLFYISEIIIWLEKLFSIETFGIRYSPSQVMCIKVSTASSFPYIKWVIIHS